MDNFVTAVEDIIAAKDLTTQDDKRWLANSLAAARTGIDKSGKNVVQKGTVVGSAANTNEQTFWSDTIPLGTFTTKDDAIWFRFEGSFANNVGHKILKFYCGATLLVDTSANILTVGNWALECRIVQKGGGNQTVIGVVFCTGFTGLYPVYVNEAETMSFSVDNLMKFTAQSAGGLANDIVLNWTQARFERAPQNAK